MCVAGKLRLLVDVLQFVEAMVHLFAVCAYIEMLFAGHRQVIDKWGFAQQIVDNTMKMYKCFAG